MGEWAGQRDPRLEEVGRIDFLLNELARAVERGEVHLASYELLAPRYLARRAELVAAIEGVPQSAVPGLEPRLAEAAGVFTTVPAVGTSAEPVTQASTEQVAGTGPVHPSAVERGPASTQMPATGKAAAPRQPKPVPWTTILTFLGAFLVIVASAIFAVATWDVFSVPVKLAGLVTVTVAFYVAAEMVDARLHLRTGSITLAVVSAAMLLFDAWVVIDGYDLVGPLPWALTLLVCSVAYWVMELRLGSGIFAVVGAAAQLAWWWLLTAALGLSVPWQCAGIATVGALWAMVGARVPAAGPLAPFRLVLRWGGIGAIGLSAGWAAWDAVTIGPPTLSQTLACAVIGAAGLAAVLGMKELPGGAAAVAQIALVASTVMFLNGDTEWWQVVLIGVAAVGYGLYELARGGWAIGGLALAAELLFWVGVCDKLGVVAAYTMCVLATVGLSWLLAQRFAARTGTAGLVGMSSLTRMATWGGWGVLVGSTLMAPLAVWDADGSLALLGVQTSGMQVIVAAWVSALWFAASFVTGHSNVAWVGVAGSFWTVGAIAGRFAPELDPSYYALMLLGLAAVWLVSSRLVQESILLDARAMQIVMRAAAGVIFVVGLLTQDALETIRAWPAVALAVGSTLFWALDAARNGFQWSWAGASGSAVAAVAIAAWRVADRSEAALAVSVVVLVICVAVAAAVRLRPGSRMLGGPFALGSVGVGTLCVALLWLGLANPQSSLVAYALSLLGAAWLAASVVLGLRWPAWVGGSVASLAPMVLGDAPPLLGEATSAHLVAVVALATAVWFAAARLHHDHAFGIPGMVGTYAVLAAFLNHFAPDWQTGHYAAAIIALAVAWSQARGRAADLVGVADGVAVWGSRVVTCLATLAAFGGEWITNPGSDVVTALVVASVFWAADAARDPSEPFPFGVGVLTLTALAGVGVVQLWSDEVAATAAAVTGAVLSAAGAAAVVRRPVEAGSARVRVAGACAAGAATLTILFVESGWLPTLVLAAVAVAWAGACYASDLAGYAAVASGFVLLTAFSALDQAGASAWFTVIVCAMWAFAQLIPMWLHAPAGSLVRRVSRVTAVCGLVTVLVPIVLALPHMSGLDLTSASWVRIGGAMFTATLAVAGGWVLAYAFISGFEPAYYVGYGAVVMAVLYQLGNSGVARPEVYTTILGLYVIAMGYLFSRLGSARKVPMGTDIAGVVLLLGVPSVLAVRATGVEDAWIHAVWAVGLSVVAIGVGVAARVRAYFFAGVASIVWVSLLYSFNYLIEFWWLVLGIVGVAMLVIALTWERQRTILTETRGRLRAGLMGWR